MARNWSHLMAVGLIATVFACAKDESPVSPVVGRTRFLPLADPCTVTCYVDAVNGNDANGGAVADPKKTIQAALNQVSAGGTVRVLPGTYNEAAPNSAPTSLGGTYQFGLFFSSSKAGITLMGVSSTDVPVTDGTATLATINTQATNNFGTSGVFVEAANTTIQGVAIGPNAAGDNKTIEVVADNFTLRNAKIAVPEGGSVYINDFSAAGDVVKSYHLVGNQLTGGTSIDISSGAGLTGPVSGREILGNTFDMDGAGWNAISFNGSGTGVEWFTNSVGGAIIKSNSFRNGGLQYIRARGTYDNTQFAWASYFTDNTFDKATVALANAGTFSVQTYAYTSGPTYNFLNVRRIGVTIQGEIDHTVSGNTVLAKSGVYTEQVTIDHSLALKGAGAATTTILAPATLPSAAQATSAVVLVSGSAAVNAEITGFSVSGPGPSGCGSIRAGLFVRDGARANIHDNNISDIRDNPFSGCQNGVGILVGRNYWSTSGSAVITNNVIAGFQKGGIVVDNDGSVATIQGNTVTGFGPTNITAQNGIQISRGATGTVTGNTISGINYTGAYWDACAILLYDAGGVGMNNNMFRNSNKNLCNAGRGGGKASATP